MNSTYPSTIWDKSSASYARAFAKNSVLIGDNDIDVATDDNHENVNSDENNKKLK